MPFRYCPNCGAALDPHVQNSSDKLNVISAETPGDDIQTLQRKLNHGPGPAPFSPDQDVQLPPMPPPRSLFRRPGVSENAGFHAPPEDASGTDKGSRRIILLAFAAGVITAGLLLVALMFIK
jgi:hypothetical protein